MGAYTDIAPGTKMEILGQNDIGLGTMSAPRDASELWATVRRHGSVLPWVGISILPARRCGAWRRRCFPHAYAPATTAGPGGAPDDYINAACSSARYSSGTSASIMPELWRKTRGAPTYLDPPVPCDLQILPHPTQRGGPRRSIAQDGSQGNSGAFEAA